MADLNVIEYMGPAKGIWQGPNPPVGSAYDCCNVDLSTGRWQTRPGVVCMTSAALGGLTDTAVGIGEYLSNNSYQTSHFNTLLCCGTDDAGTAHFYEVPNTQTATSISAPTGSKDIGGNDRFQIVRHLWKRTVGGQTLYGPCLVLVAGGTPPMVYHQFDEAGAMVLLDSINGGFSDISYLAQPPQGKYAAVHNSRLFIANCTDAGNRIWFTAPDSGGAWVCNVWPSSYNIDVGKQPITGIVSWREYLLVFNEHEIWAMSGDGAGGQYTVDLVDGKHGAINGQSIVTTGEGVYFIGREGIYKWSGGEAEQISHPAIQDLWTKITLTGHLEHSCYDPKTHNVIFGFRLAGESSNVCNSMFVYNERFKNWTRWGTWGLDYLPNIYMTKSGAMSVMLHSSIFNGIVGLGSSATWKPIKYVYGGLNQYTLGTAFATEWMIYTNHMITNDQGMNLCRNFYIKGRMSGNWSMYIIPHADGDNLADALRRNSINSTGTRCYNIIDNAASSATHSIVPDRTFIAGDVVDLIWFSRAYLHTASDTLPSQSGVIPSNIKFGQTIDTSLSGEGELMVVYAGTWYKSIAMYDSGDSLPGTANNEDIICKSLAHSKKSCGTNIIGRSFRFFLSNRYSSTAYPCLDMTGWGILTRPLGTMRM